jgi:NAD(P)H-quinone oxidoreductase subunit 6
VGAIILARREYLPDTTPQTVLTLPERPRELVSAGSEPKE